METDVFYSTKCTMSKTLKLEFAMDFDTAIHKKDKKDNYVTCTETGVFSIVKSDFKKSIKSKCVHVTMYDGYEPLGLIDIPGWTEVE